MAAWHHNVSAASSLAVSASGPAARTVETPKIRVLFMGTPAFAASLLQTLLDAEYHVVGVVTRPDRPVGRMRERVASPVKVAAQKHNIPILQPPSFDPEALETIRGLQPDLVIVAAYGRLLPRELLELPGFGCLNVHTSLLPRWRGASPIQNALLAGDTETGVTLMLMNTGMDTGPLLTHKRIAIHPDDTQLSLLARLTVLAQTLLLESLPLWIKRQITPVPQDDGRATLCQLIERSDGRILWSEEAARIYDRYRAFFEWPGIFTFWKKGDELLRLKLLRITYQKDPPPPPHPLSQVFMLRDKVAVQAGLGAVVLEEIQLEGREPLSLADFLRGNPDFLGSLLQ